MRQLASLSYRRIAPHQPLFGKTETEQCDAQKCPGYDLRVDPSLLEEFFVTNRIVQRQARLEMHTRGHEFACKQKRSAGRVVSEHQSARIATAPQ
jgi:hypothetical protein